MEEKVLEQKWNDSALSDVNEAVCRANEVIRTADEITDEKAKFKLLEGANIILSNCIDAIKTRMKNGEILANDGIMETVTEEIDD